MPFFVAAVAIRVTPQPRVSLLAACTAHCSLYPPRKTAGGFDVVRYRRVRGASWLCFAFAATRTPSCRGGSAGESKLFPIGCPTPHTSRENNPLLSLPPPHRLPLQRELRNWAPPGAMRYTQTGVTLASYGWQPIPEPPLPKGGGGVAAGGIPPSPKPVKTSPHTKSPPPQEV